MGFKLSYQQQRPNFQQDPARETMYYFWFVYLSGRLKIQLLFYALLNEDVFIPFIWPAAVES